MDTSKTSIARLKTRNIVARNGINGNANPMEANLNLKEGNNQVRRMETQKRRAIRKSLQKTIENDENY